MVFLDECNVPCSWSHGLPHRTLADSGDPVKWAQIVALYSVSSPRACRLRLLTSPLFQHLACVPFTCSDTWNSQRSTSLNTSIFLNPICCHHYLLRIRPADHVVQLEPERHLRDIRHYALKQRDSHSQVSTHVAVRLTNSRGVVILWFLRSGFLRHHQRPTIA